MIDWITETGYFGAGRRNQTVIRPRGYRKRRRVILQVKMTRQSEERIVCRKK